MGISIIWLVALVLFMIMEAITVGLTSIWFAAGALGALITSFFTSQIVVQIGVFLVVTSICMLLVRPWAAKFLTNRRIATNADRVIGAEAVVTEAIDNLAAKGQVSVAGAMWTARAEGTDAAIPQGTKVRVLRIEGVKVIVAPLTES